MITFRPYQTDCATQCVALLQQFNIAYLAAQVRTGKSLTSMLTMQMMNKQHVLFVTKKKAMSSIQKDFDSGEFTFKLSLINYESVHTIDTSTVDAIVCDESHCVGSGYPKPGLRAQKLKEIIGGKDLLLMSGTPSPETFVQLFHQFWIHKNSPWKEMKSFYHWANCGYVHKYQRPINGFNLTFYDRGNESKIMADVKKYMVTLTQEEAEFECPVEEKFHSVRMQEKIYHIISELKKDKVTKIWNNGEMRDLIIDTPAKAQMKFRQIYSGTVKDEEGNGIILDTSKMEYIVKRFAGKKIAIYYCFIEEGNMIQQYFPNWTSDPIEFAESNDKTFISQMISGREGVGLMSADCLIAYNIDFSSTTYFQMRARLQDKNRTTPAEVHWIFSESGIEEKIYKVVSKKKQYTAKHFLKDFNLQF